MQNINSLVIETFNNSGKKAAKKVFNLLIQLNDIDKKTAKQLALSLKNYIG